MSSSTITGSASSSSSSSDTATTVTKKQVKHTPPDTDMYNTITANEYDNDSINNKQRRQLDMNDNEKHTLLAIEQQQQQQQQQQHQQLLLNPRQTSSCTNNQKLNANSLKLVIHSFLSFVICSLDRINMSVAIIPMSKRYNWSTSRQGIIQSIFFLGYMFTMIPGGRLADRKGGKIILATGVFIWSLATLFIPLSSSFLPMLLLCRVILGAGEGVAMPSMNAMISKHVPTHYKARSLAFIYSGMYMGSIIGLIFTPVLLHYFNWQSAFYVYAVVGIVWVAAFWYTTDDDNNNGSTVSQSYILQNDIDMEQSPSLSLSLSPSTSTSTSTSTSSSSLIKSTSTTSENEIETHSESEKENRISREAGAVRDESQDEVEAETEIDKEGEYYEGQPTIYEMFNSMAVWAIIVGHFCCTWGYFVLVAWLPTYLYDEFKLDISSSSLLSTLPWISMFLFSNIGGYLSDYLTMTTNLEVTTIRKINQTIGFLGPCIFLTLLICISSLNNLTLSLMCISLTLATSAFSQSGVYANHHEIGPKCAGTLLGISSTISSLPGLIGVYLSGLVLQLSGNNWNMVFAMALFFYAFGLVFYNLFATSKRIW